MFNATHSRDVNPTRTLRAHMRCGRAGACA
jgi:hypothetical protein